MRLGKGRARSELCGAAVVRVWICISGYIEMQAADR